MLISHDRRFLTRLSRATIWLDRGMTRRIERGFAAFEEWRDQVLEEEEREQHKLGRKIVAEEHWMRYGVTARRKRNVRRVTPRSSHSVARESFSRKRRSWLISTSAERDDASSFSSHSMAGKSR